MVLWRASARSRTLQASRTETTTQISRKASHSRRRRMIDKEALDLAVLRFPYRLRLCRGITDATRRTVMRVVYDAICYEYGAILREKSQHGRQTKA